MGACLLFAPPTRRTLLTFISLAIPDEAVDDVVVLVSTSTGMSTALFQFSDLPLWEYMLFIR